MATAKKKTRLESDSIGTKEVPVNAYYGVQSLRAMENFSITGHRVHKEMINALARLKKACAMANAAAGVIDGKNYFVSDVEGVCCYDLETKTFSDYSGNNVNHPNEFLARAYAHTVLKTLTGKEL